MHSAIKKLFIGFTLALSSSQAAAVEWLKVLDTQTPLPDAPRPTVRFSGLALSGDNLAFAAELTPEAGYFHAVYARINGQFIKVMDDQMAPPGRSENFHRTIYSPDIHGDTVTFQAYTPNETGDGIYTWRNGQLSVVADTSMLIPGTSVNFFDFNGPTIRNGRVAFAAYEDIGPAQGIYTDAGGTLRTVADVNTPFPSSSGTFTNFPFLLRSQNILADGRIIFLAAGEPSGPGPSRWGVFESGPSGIRALVEEQVTPLPSSNGVFTNLNLLVADDDGSFAVEEFASGPQRGVYVFQNGTVRAAFDHNTPIPGGTGNFTQLKHINTEFAYDAGGVLFQGYAGEGDFHGVYYSAPDGSIIKLVDTNDTFDGKGVRGVFIDRDSLDGPRAGVVVQFDDGSEGAYIAIIPEPSAFLLLFALPLFQRRR